tara:strand:- start:1835 stop:2005 length:171 start_codon:yes stop_codon:yes gene_type:complete
MNPTIKNREAINSVAAIMPITLKQKLKKKTIAIDSQYESDYQSCYLFRLKMWENRV